MKKYLLAAIFALLSCFPCATPKRASAQTLYDSYAYVPTSSVYFYSDEPNEDLRCGLFRLPYTYYVRILSEDADYYRAEYLTDGANTQKLVGYCKKSEVVLVDYVPEMPYLYLTLDVTYTLEGNAKDEGFSEIVVTCAYYGDYNDGTRLYAYVLRGEKFGYVLKPSYLSYELNGEYAERMKEISSSETEEDEDVKSSPVKIVFLVLLCLLVPALAAVILRQPGKHPYESEE